MGAIQIVLDTNVLVAALRSSKGASHHLLRLIDSGNFQLNISVPLVLEYEASAKRLTSLSSRDVDAVIDYICAVSRPQKIHYLWRPILSDPQDDMVLELAVAGGCGVIVTYNKSDFAQAHGFGIQILTPKDFLKEIGGLP
ncbi:MAG: putative toxin-antitoxin system toxin component, PIN family [Elusimicrobia bacterium RIFCSPLOWO2_12_FULL_59_9]|nr:MAG: putative toxin-antitoxin system toxin component, PIN family [Elusimicrobia bacterium RIFCSPLOWO2_12_FULL_59_9]